MSIDLRSALIALYLLACLVLGGASNEGFVVNLVLQLMGVAIILWAFLANTDRPLASPDRRLMRLTMLVCCLIAFQFVPLPMSVWQALPGRSLLAADAELAGFLPRIAFISLTPHDSLKAAVWALPALAMVIATVRLRPSRPVYLAAAILLAMALSVVLSALQIKGGRETAWYFYEITNRGSTVGFFANSNHLATLLLISFPFLAALARMTMTSTHASRAAIGALCGALCVLGLLGIYLNGSLAGYGLILPVLAACLVILFPSRKRQRLSLLVLLPVIGAGIVLVLATEEGGQLLNSGSALSHASRNVIFANSWQASLDYFPTGSGLGSFVEVYRMYENLDTVMPSYVNHAHNDYLEIILETGLAGLIVLALFLVWWARHSFRIWTSRQASPLAQAAVVASATILTHSLVDYPLRTAAVSAIFAVCCALMISPMVYGRLPARSGNRDEKLQYSD